VANLSGGIWSAVLTPLDDDLQPDCAKALRWYDALLSNGCDGINVLGTTGEAMSFGTAQRRRLMEAVASSGLPMERAMAGTGAASLDDAVRLTRAAFDCGFAAALVMPPFFFRDVSDDGTLRFFDALLARAAPARGRVVLYNFPRMSGVVFHPDLVDRLIAAFPEAIGGLKDSSNDRALQIEVLARHPQLPVYPGSERDLTAALAYGAAGCISGSVALWPQLAQDVFRRRDATAAAELASRRDALEGFPFVSAVRYAVARATGDASWESGLPPLQPLGASQKETLERRLATAAKRS
jgi:4-hydroxy-tetrahydrodipicolinate synthase